MRQPEEVLKEWIDALVNEAKKPLTKWEEGFLESVADQLERNGYLTDSQIDKLEKIYAEKT